MNLITGATGFIGRHLALRLLREREPIRVLCRKDSISRLDPEIAAHAEIAVGDLRNDASLREATRGAVRIFNSAGVVSDWGSEEEFLSINVEGTRRLLECAKGSTIERFVHLSSIAVFGVPSPAYFDDSTPYGPGHDLYSKTKIEGEKLALRYAREHHVPVTVLRPAVVYGRHSAWLEEPLAMIRKQKMFLIGNGAGTCHACYIENLVDALILVARHPQAVGNAYTVSDDHPVSFKEYFNEIAQGAGYAPIQRSIPLPVARAMASTLEISARLLKSRKRPLLTHTAIDMISTQSRLSMQKLREELGFQPRFTIHSAMQDIFVNY